jgi:hypothetical protein
MIYIYPNLFDEDITVMSTTSKLNEIISRYCDSDDSVVMDLSQEIIQKTEGSISSHQIKQNVIEKLSEYGIQQDNEQHISLTKDILGVLISKSRRSSPAHSRRSSPAHTRHSSPAHSRRSSPAHSRRSSPAHAHTHSRYTTAVVHSRHSSPVYSRHSSPGSVAHFSDPDEAPIVQKRTVSKASNGTYYSALVKMICDAIKGDEEALNFTVEIAEPKYHRFTQKGQESNDKFNFSILDAGNYTIREILEHSQEHGKLTTLKSTGTKIACGLAGILTSEYKDSISPRDKKTKTTKSGKKRGVKKGSPGNSYTQFLKFITQIKKNQVDEYLVSTVHEPQYRSKGSEELYQHEFKYVIDQHLDQQDINLVDIVMDIVNAESDQVIKTVQLSSIVWSLLTQESKDSFKPEVPEVPACDQ